MSYRRNNMITISEFIADFAENHTVTHSDDFTSGIIEEVIKEDIYLVNNNLVKV